MHIAPLILELYGSADVFDNYDLGEDNIGQIGGVGKNHLFKTRIPVAGRGQHILQGTGC